jgi:hypothetical protein
VSRSFSERDPMTASIELRSLSQSFGSTPDEAPVGR